MQAVHFGAGNIGRGFIGTLLDQSGYETVFVDVNAEIIRALNEQGTYRVILMGQERETMQVQNIRGINSVTDAEAVVEAIRHASLITTAVGPNVLPLIAGLIADGLKVRAQDGSEPLNVIACENMIGGSTQLKEHIFARLTDYERAAVGEVTGFPDAAVDRIVPDQRQANLLDVAVEPYYEWVVEQTAVRGQLPPVEGITYVDDLGPYIERKLFTVNTGHTVPAYFGRYKGYQTIYEAMQDEEVEGTLRGALAETGEVLIRQHGFNRHDHEAYAEKIIHRFQNPNISDHVTRVGRGPIRKLGRNDRLIRPAVLYTEETGEAPEYLTTVIAAVLLYVNDEDEEARRLQELVAESGFGGALQSVSGLDADHPVVKAAVQKAETMGAAGTA